MSKNQNKAETKHLEATDKGKIIIRHPRKTKKTDIFTPVVRQDGSLVTGQKFIPESERGEHAVVVDKETQFYMLNPTTIDLNDEVQATHWGWLQHHSWIAKTKEEGMSKGTWYIDNPKEEAKRFVSNKMKVYELVGKIKDLSLEDKRILVRMMGVKDSGMWTQDLIDQHLIEHAEIDDTKSDKDYTKISKILEDDGMFKTLSFIYKAVDNTEKSGVSESYGNYLVDRVLVGTLDDMISWVKSKENIERVLVIKQNLGI
jgi:hypothetical protein